eukprot:939144_1
MALNHALRSYRKILRSSLNRFRKDPHILQGTLIELRKQWDANRNVTDEKKIAELIKTAEEAELTIRTKLARNEINKTTEGKVAKLDKDNMKIIDARKMTFSMEHAKKAASKARKCCREPQPETDVTKR